MSCVDLYLCAFLNGNHLGQFVNDGTRLFCCPGDALGIGKRVEVKGARVECPAMIGRAVDHCSQFIAIDKADRIIIVIAIEFFRVGLAVFKVTLAVIGVDDTGHVMALDLVNPDQFSNLGLGVFGDLPALPGALDPVVLLEIVLIHALAAADLSAIAS